ncbi:MAG: TonB-dependent receptor [Spongiibacteraceae bacterium]
MNKVSAIILGLTAVSSMFSATAQSAEEKPALSLEEVLVTAQRKSESLQDTPISITAFGEERLEIEGISSLSDIGSKVPSLTIEPFPINNATLRIFIRGIGISDVQVTQDTPIGIYVDGVYIARSTGTALDIADLQRIEVLRGPQGTLYGRNTTGGAINLITRPPDFENFELKQKFTIGDRNLLTSKTSVNIPLRDNFAAKLAYLYTEMDGFIDNTGPGGDFGDREVKGLRLDLRWDVSDNLSLSYAYDSSDFRYINQFYQSIWPAEQDKGQAEPVREYGVSQSRHGEKRFSSQATTMPMETSTTSIDGHALIINKDFDNFQFKYIGAYRELYDASYADLGGGLGSPDYRLDSHEFCGPSVRMQTGDDCLPLVIPEITQEQFSHEIQISGSLFNEQLDYIAGVYYFEEDARENNGPLHHQFSSKLSPGLIPIPVLGEILGGTLFGAGDVGIVNMLSQIYDINNTAKAVFGQFTWTPGFFDKRLHLTFGGRYSQDHRKALKNQTDKTYVEIKSLDTAIDMENLGAGADVFANFGFLIPDDRSFDNILGDKEFDDISLSAIAEFDINDDINIYAKVVQGYKSGGFNTRDSQRGSTGFAPGTPGKGDDTDRPAVDGQVYGYGYADGFDEEHLTSFEGGIKSELWQRRLRFNANVFFSQYKDIQLNFSLAGAIADTKVPNAGEAEMSGIETDITFIATENLLLMFNYAYLHAEITEATDDFGRDATHRFLFYSAPQHSYTVNTDWTITTIGSGELTLNLNYNFVDYRHGNPDREHAKNSFIRAYGIMNGRLSLNNIEIANHSTLSVGLWAKNLLDREYEITAVDNFPQSDRSVIWAEPRSIGLDVLYQY